MKMLLVDTDRCAGCYACEIACKQENSLEPGVRWVRVNQIGPTRNGGTMLMSFIPIMGERCTLCSHRPPERRPACVEACPLKALTLCSEAQALTLLRNGKRWQVCRVKENGGEQL